MPRVRALLTDTKKLIADCDEALKAAADKAAADKAAAAGKAAADKAAADKAAADKAAADKAAAEAQAAADKATKKLSTFKLSSNASAFVSKGSVPVVLNGDRPAFAMSAQASDFVPKGFVPVVLNGDDPGDSKHESDWDAPDESDWDAPDESGPEEDGRHISDCGGCYIREHSTRFCASEVCDDPCCQYDHSVLFCKYRNGCKRKECRFVHPDGNRRLGLDEGEPLSNEEEILCRDMVLVPEEPETFSLEVTDTRKLLIKVIGATSVRCAAPRICEALEHLEGGLPKSYLEEGFHMSIKAVSLDEGEPLTEYETTVEYSYYMLTGYFADQGAVFGEEVLDLYRIVNDKRPAELD